MSGTSGTRNGEVTLRYSERLRHIAGFDNSGKPVFSPLNVKADWMNAEVVAVDQPLVQSPSIAGDRWLAVLKLADDSVMPGHPDAAKLKLWYDKHALIVPDFRVGSQWKVAFGERGEFVDVEPAATRKEADKP